MSGRPRPAVALRVANALTSARWGAEGARGSAHRPPAPVSPHGIWWPQNASRGTRRAPIALGRKSAFVRPLPPLTGTEGNPAETQASPARNAPRSQLCRGGPPTTRLARAGQRISLKPLGNGAKSHRERATRQGTRRGQGWSPAPLTFY